MKTDVDVYGALVADVLEGRRAMEVVERDDGLVMAFDARYLIEPFSRWSDPNEKRAMRFVRGRVLDVGCGGGRVCLHLQDRGHEVLGIDTSPGAIRCCKRRGVREARLLAAEDLTPALGSFDTIVMIGQNFGMMRSRAGVRRFLRRFSDVATDRARIVIETYDPFVDRDEAARAYRERNERRGRMAGQLRVRVRYRFLSTPWFDWLQVSEEELRQLLQGTDWVLSRRIGEGPSYVAIIERA